MIPEFMIIQTILDFVILIALIIIGVKAGL
jgi:hypothetical protein